MKRSIVGFMVIVLCVVASCSVFTNKDKDEVKINLPGVSIETKGDDAKVNRDSGCTALEWMPPNQLACPRPAAIVAVRQLTPSVREVRRRDVVCVCLTKCKII